MCTLEPSNTIFYIFTYLISMCILEPSNTMFYIFIYFYIFCLANFACLLLFHDPFNTRIPYEDSYQQNYAFIGAVYQNVSVIY
jgi:hypothetical protein